MNTANIEKILRQAPQPKPPAILRQQLKAQALRAPRPVVSLPGTPRVPGSWFSRWWPALAPTALSLACAAIFTAQQAEIRDLKATRGAPSVAGAGESVPGTTGPTLPRVTVQNGAPTAPDELERLRTLAADLRSEVSVLEAKKAENEHLRSQIAAASTSRLTTEETQALGQARDHAQSVQCVNNLKQLGLAVRVWSLDHGDVAPPNVLCLSNEIGSFKILVCPADSGRQAARDSGSFTAANCSYEYLGPSSPDTEPQRIIFRCPVHGHIGLCDGSVQMDIAKKHPEMIVQRDGKLYLQSAEPPPSAAVPANDSNQEPPAQ
jgi:hypothetical protein